MFPPELILIIGNWVVGVCVCVCVCVCVLTLVHLTLKSLMVLNKDPIEIILFLYNIDITLQDGIIVTIIVN